MPKTWIILLVLIAGASWPIQSAINGQLKSVVKQPVVASLANGAGAAVLAGAILLIGGVLLKQLSMPDNATVMRVPWWAWFGGVFSVLVIVAQSTGAHYLGTATLIALFVAAQGVSGLVVDHFGLLGMPRNSVSAQRLVGVALLVAGAILLARSTGQPQRPLDGAAVARGDTASETRSR